MSNMIIEPETAIKYVVNVEVEISPDPARIDYLVISNKMVYLPNNHDPYN